ncbi:MAG: hypothetical protein ACJZ9F_03930 [Rhodospirillaceae bacterium]
MRRILYLMAVVAYTPALAAESADLAVMAEGEAKDFVYLLCADCHSMQHVLAQGYTRSSWREALERMTLEFGMAELSKVETDLVLDYLSTNYGPNSIP